MIIVSGCLADIKCRFDGKAKPCEEVIRLMAEGKAVPLCPEQLGGLPTPRLPAEIVAGKVIQSDGLDVSERFQRGAEEAIKIACMVGARTAILKARSPSCGSGKIYDGSFSKVLIDGDGVFATMCRQNGMDVKTEEDF
jgi:uncharacterized protein YbbK (DUF523 family)